MENILIVIKHKGHGELQGSHDHAFNPIFHKRYIKID